MGDYDPAPPAIPEREWPEGRFGKPNGYIEANGGKDQMFLYSDRNLIQISGQDGAMNMFVPINALTRLLRDGGVT